MTPPGYDGNPANLTDLRDTPILVISGNESITVCVQAVFPLVYLKGGGLPGLTVERERERESE